MQSLRSRLPPANSLIAFEVVARLQSITRAARELRVTREAVSRQVRLLEQSLAIKLFERGARSERKLRSRLRAECRKRWEQVLDKPYFR